MLTAARVGAWGKSEDKPLPYDKEVEWLCFDTSGGAVKAIQLNIKNYFRPTKGTNFITEIKINELETAFYVFSGMTTTCYWPGFGIKPTELVVGKTSTSATRISHNLVLGEWHVYDLNFGSGSLFVDGDAVGEISNTSGYMLNFLFPYMLRERKVVAYVKYLMAYKDGSILFHAIPVVKDGIPHWYDKVGKSIIGEYEPEMIPNIIAGPDKVGTELAGGGGGINA